MYSPFKYHIDSVDNLKVVSMEGDESSFDILFNHIILLSDIPTNKCTSEFLQEIVDFYNNTLWNDCNLVMLTGRYISHLMKYDMKGWEKRGDFTTPETYEAFIKGIEYSIRYSIQDIMNAKFNNATQYFSDIQKGVFKCLDSLCSET